METGTYERPIVHPLREYPPGGLGDLSILPCLTVPRPGLAETVPMLGLADGAGRLASLPGVVAREEDCVQVSLLLATLRVLRR